MPDIGDRDFASQLRAQRTKLGLSQEQVARDLGVALITVSRWENGRSTPSKLAQRQVHTYLQEKTAELSRKG